MTLRRAIVANYVGRGYTMAIGYLLAPVYVAILGIEAFGIIAFHTLLLTFAGLADVGLSATFARQSARQPDKSALLRLLSASERILFVAVSALGIVVFFGSDWLATNWLGNDLNDASKTASALQLMALTLAPQLLFSLYSAGLLGMQRQVAANVLQVAFLTLRNVLVIVPILFDPDILVFLQWQLGATLAFALIARMVLVRGMSLALFAMARFDFGALRPHLKYAGGMLAITVISAINTQLDKLLISGLFPLADYGYYSLAGTAAQLPYAVAAPIAVALFPKITAEIARGELDAARISYESNAQLIALVATLSGLALAIFSPEFLAVWMQDENLPAIVAQVLTILSLGGLFLGLLMPAYYLSLAHGENGLIVAIATVTLCASIPLIFLAIQYYGLRGAAFMWLALNFINFFVISVSVNRRHYPRSQKVWLVRVVGAPVVIAAMPLAVARVSADFLDVTPLPAVLFAAVAACVSIAIFAALRVRFGGILPALDAAKGG